MKEKLDKREEKKWPNIQAKRNLKQAKLRIGRDKKYKRGKTVIFNYNVLPKKKDKNKRKKDKTCMKIVSPIIGWILGQSAFVVCFARSLSREEIIKIMLGGFICYFNAMIINLTN